jgi:molybdopterin-containing oxidoreductase family membrane subunit
MSMERAFAPGPVLVGRPGDAELTDQLLAPLWKSSKAWRVLLGFSFLGTLGLGLLMLYTFSSGIGVWGNNIPVAWAYAIINFVWWIGLGHAGTFISAFLLLLEQPWRGSINRIAEAMTLFAVMNAGLFPLLHLGRPWFFYWLLPYPATMRLWPQFRSALPWDAAAVATYFTVSLLFWYVGLVPDFAAARDRAPSRLAGRLYALASLGWRGSVRDWSRYRVTYGLLAGLATPLVISVHSVVSMDFAIAQLPGWHSTIFPPYFVVGAIYSGFALVVVLLIPIRRIFHMKNVITDHHLDTLAKILLVTGSLMFFSYVVEMFSAWYSGEPFERYVFLFMRPRGPYAPVWWTMIFCNVVVPQIYWFRKMRRNVFALFVGSSLIVVGMWIERFVIIVTSLSRDFLPSSWAMYFPTWVDWGILAGTVCFFTFLYLLFIRFVPFVPIHEIKELRHDLDRRDEEDAEEGEAAE